MQVEALYGLGGRTAIGRSAEDLYHAGAQFVGRADHLQFAGLGELRYDRIELLEPLDAPLDISSELRRDLPLIHYTVKAADGSNSLNQINLTDEPMLSDLSFE